jgi:hypothetical protein
MPTGWTVYCLECDDVAAREALMARFEREHPVEFPEDRYSVVAAVVHDGEQVETDFAWVDRYLYLTTTTEVDDLVLQTMDDWERAAVGEFDATTGTAEHVTLVLDAGAGDEGEAAGGRFEGLEGLGGMDVLYALAMRHQFRFRSYSAVPLVSHTAPHPDAFTAFGELDRFVEDMAEATGVEPTDEGLDFLRSDPAADDRYVFGETYGPVEADFAEADAAADELSVAPDDELPTPSGLLGDGELPEDETGRRRGLLDRLRGLFGR